MNKLMAPQKSKPGQYFPAAPCLEQNRNPVLLKLEASPFHGFSLDYDLMVFEAASQVTGFCRK